MSEALSEMEHGESVLASGGAMVQTKTRHVTAVAVQKPRDLRRAVAKLETEAELSGELFYYAWGEGKNRVEGPSVKLALAALRAFGNCSVEADPVQETATAFIFHHVFIDIENGITLPRQFRQAKDWTVYGKMDEPRKMDVRFQIGQSKNIRNLILNAIPSVMIDRAMESAKKGVRKKITDYIAQEDAKNPGTGLTKAREMILGQLLKAGGISAERVCHKFGIAEVTAIGIDEIIIMRGDVEAIKTGEVKAEEVYPPKPVPTTGTLKEKIENAKAAGAGGVANGSGEPAANKPPVEDSSKRSTSGRKSKAPAGGMVEGEIPNEDLPDNREREPGEDDLTKGL